MFILWNFGENEGGFVGKMMGRMLDFLLGIACLYVTGNYC